MSIDDIDVAICNDGSTIREAALAGGLTAVASPAATLTGEVEVNHTSIGSGDNDWESTSYQFEGRRPSNARTPTTTRTATPIGRASRSSRRALPGFTT